MEEFGPVPLIWKTTMEFLAFGFSLAPNWLLQNLGEQIISWKISLSLILPFKQILKKKKKQN